MSSRFSVGARLIDSLLVRTLTFSLALTISCCCLDTATAADVAYRAVEPVGAYGETIPLSSLGRQAIGLKVATVQKTPLPLQIQVPGKIESIPTRNFDQHAPLSGRITSVEVALGQVVKAGQIICTVESPDMNELAAKLLQQKTELEAEFNKQKADLDEEVLQAEAKLELSQSAYRRAVKLQSERIAAMRDVELAKTDIDLAQMRLRTSSRNRDTILAAAKQKIPLTLRPLRQQLKMLGVEEKHIESMVRDGTTDTSVPVRSARSGVITDLQASAGQSISPDDRLCTVTDLSHIWATASVFEDDMSRMKVGQKVRVVVPAFSGENFIGTLTYIGNQVDTDSRTLPVRAELANPTLKLKPDMFAELYIETASPGFSVLLPRDAVVERLGHTIVFVETKNGYQPYSVRLGRSFGDNVEITEGLVPGQKIVVQGAFQLGAELMKAHGGEALFVQATEGGDRFSEEHEHGPPGKGMTVTPLGIGVVIASAFLFGFLVAALFARRSITTTFQKFTRPGESKTGVQPPALDTERFEDRARTKHGGMDD